MSSNSKILRRHRRDPRALLGMDINPYRPVEGHLSSKEKTSARS